MCLPVRSTLLFVYKKKKAPLFRGFLCGRNAEIARSKLILAICIGRGIMGGRMKVVERKWIVKREY